MLCGPRRAVICAAVSRWRGRLSNKGEHIWLHAVHTRIDPSWLHLALRASSSSAHSAIDPSLARAESHRTVPPPWDEACGCHKTSATEGTRCGPSVGTETVDEADDGMK